MVKPQISNDEIILNYIRRHGPVSKALIARQTKITPPTVTNICANLIRQGLVYEDRQERSALGRPSMLLGFNTDIETILIVHVRTHAIVYYVTTVGQRILYQAETSIIGCTADEIMQHMYKGMQELFNGDYQIKSVGLILRGPVDSSKGISIYSPNGKWNNIPFKYILEERFHVPVYVENDVRCLSTGEYYFGSGKEMDNLIVLKFSYGLGVSLIYHGELYRGVNDSAGEIGYGVIRLDQEGNEVRLEDIASETSIHTYVLEQMEKGRYTSVQDNPLVTSKAFRVEPIYEAAVEGDEVCLEALSRVGHYLGIALANIANLFNPERIILSSAMGNAVGVMDPILRGVLERNSYKTHAINLEYSGNGSYYTLLGMIDIVSAKRAEEAWLG